MLNLLDALGQLVIARGDAVSAPHPVRPLLVAVSLLFAGLALAALFIGFGNA
jgi:hypothetical protein